MKEEEEVREVPPSRMPSCSIAAEPRLGEDNRPAMSGGGAAATAAEREEDRAR